MGNIRLILNHQRLISDSKLSQPIISFLVLFYLLILSTLERYSARVHLSSQLFSISFADCKLLPILFVATLASNFTAIYRVCLLFPRWIFVSFLVQKQAEKSYENEFEKKSWKLENLITEIFPDWFCCFFMKLLTLL